MYRNLDRPPLQARGLQADLDRGESIWVDLRVVDVTGSTNADVAELARAGAGEGLVLVAEEQRSGRGRLDRAWTSPPGAGLTFSVLLRPTAPRPSWGWLPLLTGLAVADAIRDQTALNPQLKWPNDVLLDGRKCAGVLCEVVAGAVIIGIGINITTSEPELANPAATSLALAGAATTDRAPFLKSVLRCLELRYLAWLDAPGSLHAPYVSACVTLGQRIRVTLPGGDAVEGEAVSVDPEGQLIVQTADGRATFAAGDVVHVRS